MTKPETLLDRVVDRESFIAFVQALAAERDDAAQIERENPKRYMVDGACTQIRYDIRILPVMRLDYFEDKPFHKPEVEPSWKMFADFLYFGKIIE